MRAKIKIVESCRHEVLIAVWNLHFSHGALIYALCVKKQRLYIVCIEQTEYLNYIKCNKVWFRSFLCVTIEFVDVAEKVVYKFIF